MRLNARISVSVSALLVLGASGATAVSAQVSSKPSADVPSLSREVPQSQDSPNVSPVVEGEGTHIAIPTIALVVPPSPRIVTGGPGSISIRGGSVTRLEAIAMRTRAASAVLIRASFPSAITCGSR